MSATHCGRRANQVAANACGQLCWGRYRHSVSQRCVPGSSTPDSSTPNSSTGPGKTRNDRGTKKWESNGRCVTQSTQHRCCTIYALSNTTTELAVTMKSQAYRLAVVLQPSPGFYIGFIFWEGDEFSARQGCHRRSQCVKGGVWGHASPEKF